MGQSQFQIWKQGGALRTKCEAVLQKSLCHRLGYRQPSNLELSTIKTLDVGDWSFVRTVMENFKDEVEYTNESSRTTYATINKFYRKRRVIMEEGTAVLCLIEASKAFKLKLAKSIFPLCFHFIMLVLDLDLRSPKHGGDTDTVYLNERIRARHFQLVQGFPFLFNLCTNICEVLFSKVM